MSPPDGGADGTYEVVKEYYGKVLQSSKDLKTSACTSGRVVMLVCRLGSNDVISRRVSRSDYRVGGRPHARIRKLMCSVPQEVKDKFYGCGAPLPLGIENLRVRLFTLFSHSSQIAWQSRSLSADLH